jgi:hypothetical protein
MMYFLKDRHRELCVLAVSPDILDIPGTIISGQNASRGYTLFKAAPDGLAMIDKDRVFAKSWKHGDAIEEYEHKGIMCAEILVPDEVDPCHIMRAYVSSTESQGDLEQVLGTPPKLEIVPKSQLFFI